MTPTLQKFLNAFASLGGDTSRWRFESDPPQLRHAALHEEVGELLVYDDDDELTVCLGKKHHTHIATYNYLQEPAGERLRLVAEETARFVTDIFADRILFTVDFLGNECYGSSHHYLNEEAGSTGALRGFLGVAGGNIRTERYVWSGPYDP